MIGEQYLDARQPPILTIYGQRPKKLYAYLNYVIIITVRLITKRLTFVGESEIIVGWFVMTATPLPMKLWIYTNYDCNLRCSYCVAESSPRAARRAINLETVQQLVDEAAELGFEHLYFTGGEPLILDEIYAMLAYAAARLPTTLLTNAMLLRGRRLERLRAVDHPNLVVQVSLDGGQPAHHDAYRGAGSWEKTVAGLHTLLEHGFRVRLSTTETPANCAHLDEICAFHRELGIPEAHHFIRPLARRGFSSEGQEVNQGNLVPELTVNREGVFWHPLSTDADMLVSEQIFPLAESVACVQQLINRTGQVAAEPARTFT